MASTEVNVPISKLMSDVTMNVNLTGVRTWRVRVWLGIQLLKLAGRIIGCGIHIEGPSA